MIGARSGPTRLTHACWLVPTLVAAALAFAWLESVPGLSTDEVWALGRVAELRAGARPVRGMFVYCGAIPQYLAWPAVAWLGPSALAVRLPGAILGTLAVGVTAWTLRDRLDARTALAGGLLLATAPIFVGATHLALDLWTLPPVLAATAFAALARAGDETRASLARAAVGGVALGLMVYTHLATAPAALALLVAVIAVRGRAALTDRRTHAALVGFAVGVLPLVAAFVEVGAEELGAMTERGGWPPWSAMPTEGSPFRDLPYVPWVLGASWDGTLPYRSWAGGSELGVLPLYPLLALFALAWLRRRAGTAPVARRATALAVAAALGGALLVPLIAPRLTIRYFVVFHLALAITPALVAAPLLSHARRLERRAAVAIVGVVVGLNAIYVGANYFAPFLRHGGGSSVHRIGTRMVDTSNALVRTEPLLARLRALGVRRYAAHYIIAGPLSVLDEDGTLERFDPDAGPGDGRAALVFHDGPQWTPDATAEPDDARTWGDTLERGGVVYRLDPGAPRHFRIYVTGETPAAAPPEGSFLAVDAVGAARGLAIGRSRWRMSRGPLGPDATFDEGAVTRLGGRRFALTARCPDGARARTTVRWTPRGPGVLLTEDTREGACAPSLPSATWWRAPSGTIAYARGDTRDASVSPRSRVVLLDLEALRYDVLETEADAEAQPRWSMDGARLALSAFDAATGWDLLLVDPDGGPREPLSTGPLDDLDPAWSPDGASIAFHRGPREQPGWTAADLLALETPLSILGREPGEARDVVRRAGIIGHPAWSPDGSRIAFRVYRFVEADPLRGHGTLYSVAPDGRDLRELIVATDDADTAPVWTPDGTRIVFFANRHGEPGMRSMRPDGTDVRPFGDDREHRIPDWSPDGAWRAAAGPHDLPTDLRLTEDSSGVVFVLDPGPASEPRFAPR